MSDQNTNQVAADEKPLVSFALFAYNQEKYIREAVEGALAQTYSPLQVILSDDCSTDRTFEIMREMVADYFGPHEILLNRNERNLGIGAHVNKLMKIVKGELIVVAAGDDISLPHRTSTLVSAWSSQSHPLVVCSSFTSIDESGNVIGQPIYDQNSLDWLNEVILGSIEIRRTQLHKFLQWELFGLYGATAFWTKDIFQNFGYFRPDVWYEDRVVFLRALLLRSLLLVPDQLVLYRTHEESFTNCQSLKIDNFGNLKLAEEKFEEKSFRRLGHLKQHCEDIKQAYKQRLLDEESFNALYKEIKRQLDVEEAKSVWWKSTLLNRVCSLYPRIRRSGQSSDIGWANRRIFPILFLFLLRRVKYHLHRLREIH